MEYNEKRKAESGGRKKATKDHIDVVSNKNNHVNTFVTKTLDTTIIPRGWIMNIPSPFCRQTAYVLGDLYRPRKPVILWRP